MKIAVLLSGEFRTGAECLHGFVEFFKGYSVDFFYHTWTTNTWYLHNSKKGTSEFTVEKINVDEVTSALHLINAKGIIEECPDWRHPYTQSQQYSMHTANKLKREFEASSGFKYDVVVKMRFDLFFPCVFNYTSVEEDTVYVTQRPVINNCPSVLDRFFFADSATMDKICDIYLETAAHYADPNADIAPPPFCYPEAHLCDYLKRANIKTVLHGYNDFIMRKECVDAVDFEDKVNKSHSFFR